MDQIKERIHTTQKPVEVYVKPILNHTCEKDFVIDPFAGSGVVFPRIITCNYL